MKEQEKSRLIIVAGPNGAGKTTITEKLLRHEWLEGCEYINPVFIAQRRAKSAGFFIRIFFVCTDDPSKADADPRLLFRVSEGKVAKIYTEIAPWANGILKAIPRCGDSE